MLLGQQNEGHPDEWPCFLLYNIPGLRKSQHTERLRKLMTLLIIKQELILYATATIYISQPYKIYKIYKIYKLKS